MTKEQFKKALLGSANMGRMFEFFTDQNEGVVFHSDDATFIWVDEIGFGKTADNAEPKYSSKYQSIDEMLSAFMVNGELFADLVLPNIKDIRQIYV